MASVKAGAQITLTRGKQNVNGRTDAMRVPNAVVSYILLIFARSAIFLEINEQIVLVP